MLGTHARHVTGPGPVALGRAWLRRTAAAAEAGAPIRPGERGLTRTREGSGALVVATGHAISQGEGTGGGRPWSPLGWEGLGPVRRGERTPALRPPRLRGPGP